MIGECGLELTWLAAVLVDHVATRSAATLVLDAAPHGGEPQIVQTARGYLALGDGDAPGARRIFAALRDALPVAADAAWWETLASADLGLGLALALEALRDPVGARTELARATRLYDQIAASMPQPAIARRRQAVAAITARLGP